MIGLAGCFQHRDRAQARSRPRTVALAVLLVATVATIAGSASVPVTVDYRDGGYEVRGSFTTVARLDTVWEVLTDYEHIPSFVTAVKHSDVERRADGLVKVRQVASVGVFPLRRSARVTLDVREEAGVRIEFRDMLGKDFSLYSGEWSLSGDSTRTVVAYALAATPRGMVPRWLGRSMMSRSASDLLSQVRAEIERRAAER